MENAGKDIGGLFHGKPSLTLSEEMGWSDETLRYGNPLMKRPHSSVVAALAMVMVLCLRADAMPHMKKPDVGSLPQFTASDTVNASTGRSMVIGNQRYSPGQRACIALGDNLSFAVTLDVETMRLLKSVAIAGTDQLTLSGPGRGPLLHHLYGKIVNNKALQEAEALETHYGEVVLVDHVWTATPSKLNRMPLARQVPLPEPENLTAHYR
jgi:hypothetical protein